MCYPVEFDVEPLYVGQEIHVIMYGASMASSKKPVPISAVPCTWVRLKELFGLSARRGRCLHKLKEH
jgi:hypothetical protein